MTRKIRLQTKLSLLLGLVALAVVSVSVTIFTIYERRELQREVHRELLFQTTTISRRVGQLLYSSNWRFLLIGLNNDKENHPDIVYFFLTDPDGNILLSDDARRHGQSDPGIVPAAVDPLAVCYRDGFRSTAPGFPDNNSFLIQEVQLKEDLHHGNEIRGHKGDLVFDTWWQVVYAGEHLGHLRIGYAQTRLLSRVERLRNSMLLFGGFLFLMLLTSVHLLVRRSLAPLSYLRKSLVEFNTGDVELFRQRLQEFSPLDATGDTREVEDLRLSFERMRRLLIRNWDVEARHRSELETEVGHRTGELQEANNRLVDEVKDRQKAEDRLRRQNTYLAALHDTVLGVVSSLELTDLLAVLLDRAGDLMGTRHGFLMILDENREEMVVRHATGAFTRGMGRRIVPGEGLSGRAWVSDRPMIVDDYASWPHGLEMKKAGLKSTIVVPLKGSDGVNGMIGFGDYTSSRHFDAEDQDILCRFAELTGIALSNASLHTALQNELAERMRVEAENRQIQHQLLQAQKLEAIGKLAGGIAHDINNLLMAIQGHLSLMALRMGETHPQTINIRHMESLVESGSRMTHQLLGFARGGKYEAVPTDVNVLAGRTLDMFSRTRKEIVIHRMFAEDLATVEVDRIQIEQVLMNLAVNASQAMPDGGTLTVVTENAVPDASLCRTHGLEKESHVRIRVTDSGVGMAPEVMAKIFDPFFTTRETTRGTGLGLSSAYGIMRNHGGCILARSSLGKGSTFTLWLPASGKALEEAAPRDAAVVDGSETLLLVDDEAMVREVAQELLLALGYRVLVAENGAEGLRIYREEPSISLVLLDLVMPGMGGGEVFAALRKTDPDVQVLLVSGYSIDGVARRLLEEGAAGFLQKPFDVASLSRKIRSVLDEGGAAA